MTQGFLSQKSLPSFNRTKVELKLLKLHKHSILLKSLSIVPKWNWNREKEIEEYAAFWLSIVPKWNWNFYIIKPVFLNVFFQSYQSGIEIMRLHMGSFFLKLSIVPKWNWNQVILNNNYFHNYFQSYQSGIEISIHISQEFISKFFQSYQSGIEIKWTCGITTGIIRLSIVPKWNWNDKDDEENQIDVDFQSYQSGIEMNWIKIFNQLILTFNRTKVELKLAYIDSYNVNPSLSIVPKWNWNFICFLCIGFLCALSIVPKWNWNEWCKVPAKRF